jgi:hypothetical protein
MSGVDVFPPVIKQRLVDSGSHAGHDRVTVFRRE